MLIGIGIDILSISRFASLLSRRSPLTVAKRICTKNEIEQFAAIKGEAAVLRYLSTRWVLKEAGYKALSARYPVTWKNLEVDHLHSGQPVMRYDGTVDLMCTLSHDAGVVVGVVIAQKNG